MNDVASHDVATRAVWAAIRLLERGNFPTDRVLGGLAYDIEALKTRRHVSWDDYVTVCENTVAIAGGVDVINELAEEAYHEVFPEVRVLARALIEPKALLRFVMEVIDPMVWPALHCVCEDLGGDDMRVTVRIRPGARPNPLFLQISIGAIRGFPRHLNLPPARVLRADISDDMGVYDVRLPPSQTLAQRVRRASRTLLERGTMHAVMGQSDVVDPLEVHLDEASVDWELSRRQIDVLRPLVQGQSNKEIAQVLGCAENTVELHVTQLLRKAAVASRGQLIARFWRGE